MIDPLASFTEEDKARLRAIPDHMVEDLAGLREDQYFTRRKLFPIGKKIDGTMLTVIGSRRSERGPEIICQCDCAVIIAIRYRTLYGGSPYSCGCTERPLIKPSVPTDGIRRYTGIVRTGKPSRDYSGETFGRLTPLEYTARGWSCLCADCQEFEMIAPIPGQSYLALLTRAGRKPCKVREAREAEMPEWHFTIVYTDPHSPTAKTFEKGRPVHAETFEQAEIEAKKQCGRHEEVNKLWCPPVK